MAQPQQQYTMPQSSFSPPPSAESPSNGQQFPPAKRQRLSPNPPSQPASPYAPSPYAISPGASAPQTTGASPHFTTVQLPNVYNTPYANGHNTSSLSFPQSQPGPQPQPGAYQQNQANQQQYHSPLSFPNQGPSQGQMNNQPGYSQMNPSTGPGVMGPPSKPLEKNDDTVDHMDVLTGSGIDLREEESFAFDYGKSFNSQQSGLNSGFVTPGHSFSQFEPGRAASFYGAGPANAAAEKVPKSMEEHHSEVAEQAWVQAARELAMSRERELSNPFLLINTVNIKMRKIANENGLSLPMDERQMMGQFKRANYFPNPTVNVQTAVGPNGGITATSGNFIPADSQMVDHLALLSIAAKHRLRGLVEDANKLARGRQTGSHGIIPEDWAEAAAPFDEKVVDAAEGALRSGWESAVSPLTNPQNGSLSAANKNPTALSEKSKNVNGLPKLQSQAVLTLRAAAKKEQNFEEERLKKRKARKEAVEDGSRDGSVVPGTPGAVAPEAEKPTKKEKKKPAQVNEAITHAASLNTANKFLGGKKKYSWLDSGTNTPSMSTPAKIMTQGQNKSSAPVQPAKFTQDGRIVYGSWREDKEKGRGIQIRDWITVLEDDGREKKALQKAYAWLDHSEPR